MAKLLIAAMRLVGSSAKRADRKFASWIFRALNAGSVSASIDAKSGASCAASGRRAIEATAVSRRVRSGSINWNCTSAVPINRRTPPLGLSCLKSVFGAVDVARVSTSVRASVSSSATPMKNTPSSRCQMFFSDHCSKNAVACGKPEPVIASSASPTDPRDGLVTSVAWDCKMG